MCSRYDEYNNAMAYCATDHTFLLCFNPLRRTIVNYQILGAYFKDIPCMINSSHITLMFICQCFSANGLSWSRFEVEKLLIRSISLKFICICFSYVFSELFTSQVSGSIYFHIWSLPIIVDFHSKNFIWSVNIVANYIPRCRGLVYILLPIYYILYY